MKDESVACSPIIRSSVIVEAYCDGGLSGTIGRDYRYRSSAWGVRCGTWAYLYVDNSDNCITERCGVFTPSMIGSPVVKSHVSELVAAMYALENLPEGFSGCLYTDCERTMRCVNKHKDNLRSIPDCLLKRFQSARDRMGFSDGFCARHLYSHPSEELLAANKKTGVKKYSSWNVRCHDLCLQAAWDARKSGIDLDATELPVCK